MKGRLFGLLFAALMIAMGYFYIRGEESEKYTVSDWPQFRGPKGDGISTETGLLKSWPEGGPEELWRIPIGVGYSSISVSGDRVYTMDSQGEQEFLVCIDGTNGKKLWRTLVGQMFRDSSGNGPRSAPTIDGEIVYAVSGNGHLVAVEAKNGKNLWAIDTKEKFVFRRPDNWWGFSSSPIIEGDLLLLQVGGEENKSIAAIDKRSGEVVWTSHTDFPAYSTPIAIDSNGYRQFVFITGQKVVSVSSTGEILWTYPWGGSIIKIAMPIFIPPDKIFVSASYDIGSVLLRMKTEKSTIIVEEMWNSRVMRNHFHSSIFLEGYIYGFDNAALKCIDTESGATMWSKRRRIGKGSLTYVDGHFIVLGERGTLVLVEANPNEYIEKSSFQILQGKTWTPPTLSGGKLFVRNQKEMVCLNLKG